MDNVVMSEIGGYGGTDASERHARHIDWVVSDFTDADLYAVIKSRFMSVAQATEEYGTYVVNIIHKKSDDRLRRFTVGIPGKVGKDGKERGGLVTLVSIRELQAFQRKRRVSRTVDERIADLRAKLAALGAG